ncbi:WD40/YVTN repeat-like-containing domain containing protein [Trema orientale]|uniref:WD40/YVTN repeat-like-containing domain containing protein n=1 Tax=Trema orientale TaxID=63057 RepID=A0A2P5FHJ2_TREOI|nr:WD40/YVTN repeat-like-containing domain containing protein [Trema orientale]
MVTSADSQVRILHGVDVICKYRGWCSFLLSISDLHVVIVTISWSDVNQTITWSDVNQCMTHVHVQVFMLGFTILKSQSVVPTFFSFPSSGLHNAGSQISASFTYDGTHIVSASEDSNVYVWNCRTEGPKNHWSSERFFSNKASVAIPWCSNTSRCYLSTSGASVSRDLSVGIQRYTEERGSKQSQFSSANHLSLSHGFFSDSVSKGSATWPEEKLPSNSLLVSSAKCKSQHKFIKSICQSTIGYPQSWGLVIVTASWDGRIRTFQNYGLPIRL